MDMTDKADLPQYNVHILKNPSVATARTLKRPGIADLGTGIVGEGFNNSTGNSELWKASKLPSLPPKRASQIVQQYIAKTQTLVTPVISGLSKSRVKAKERCIGIHHCSIEFDASAGKFAIKANNVETNSLLAGEDAIGVFSNLGEAGNTSNCLGMSSNYSDDIDDTEEYKENVTRKQISVANTTHVRDLACVPTR